MEEYDEMLDRVPVPSRVESFEDLEDLDDLYDLIEEDVLGLPFEYGFNSDEEMLEFLKGEGRYSDQNAYTEEGHSDAVQDQRENMGWYRCRKCLEDIEEIEQEEDADRSDIDIDPTYNFRVLSKEDGDEEKKKYAVWCDEHGMSEDGEEDRGEFIWFEYTPD